MLDLTQQKTNSVGIFSRVNMKRDSRSDSLIYDIELSFLIESEAHATLVDNVISGALEIYNASLSTEELRTTVKTTIKDPTFYIEIKDEEGLSLVQSMTEIRLVQYQANNKGVSFVIKCRMFDGEPELAHQFAVFLGKAVQVDIEQPQQKLFELNTEAETNSHFDEGLTSILVSANTETNNYIGIFERQENEEYIINTFGTEFIINKTDVISEIKIDKQSLEEFTESYKEKCQELSIPLTWEPVVIALVQNSIGDVEDDTYYLTGDLLRQSISILKSADN